MRIAFPSLEDRGLDSPVYSHFGTARFFVVVDESDNDAKTIANGDRDHLHGQCQPLEALGGVAVDAVVVGGIGGGALRKLQTSGIRVYRAVEGSVSENLELIRAGFLPQFEMNQTCAGHGKGQGCAH